MLSFPRENLSGGKDGFNAMEHLIRKMMEADWPEVSRIYQEGMDTNLATFQWKCPSWEEWDKSHLEECRWVATSENSLLGWAALTPVSGRCVFAGVAEVSVYVSTDAKRNGIGGALLFELIRSSEKNGFWMLQSGIMQDNIPSIRLHERCGFRMVGYREKIGRDRFGIWRNIVLMERRSPSDQW